MYLFQLIQLIDGRDVEVSFFLLVKKLEANLNQTKIKIGKDLLFLRGISPQIHKLMKNVFGKHPEFMHLNLMENMLSKVPEEIEIDGKNTRAFLYHKISETFVHQKAEVEDMNRQITAEIQFELSDNNKRNFVDLFKQWYNKPAEKKDVKRVKNGIGPMFSDHKQFFECFNRTMATVEKFNGLVKSCKTIVDYTRKNLLKSTKFEEIKKLTEEIVGSTVKASSTYPLLIKKLADVKTLLRNYNKRRIEWAEFIIGIRESLDEGSSNCMNSL